MPTSSSLSLYSSKVSYEYTDANLFLKSAEASLLSTVTDINSLGSLPTNKSCEFTHHTHVCINKASTNLNQLQERLEQWYKELLSHEGKREKYEKKIAKMNRSMEKHKLPDIRSGSALNVYGYDDSSTDSEIIISQSVTDIPKKSMQMVKGVINLFGRLESDRVNMVQLLTKESERTAKLGKMINQCTYKRIHDLPMRVQEELEQCICDIQELRWHYEYQGRVEERLRNNVAEAENLNNRLVEDINLVKENDPLIKEKLVIEKRAMSVVQEKQNKTDDELSIATRQLAKIRLGFEKTKRKSEHEQRDMAQNITGLSGKLNATLGNLLNAQNYHEQMTIDTLNLEKRINDNKQKIVSAQKNIEKQTEIGYFLQDKLGDCKTNINTECDKLELLNDKISDIGQEKVEEEKQLNEMRKKLEHKLSTNTKELRRMIMANKKTKKEIQIFWKKIEASENNRVSNEKAVKRAFLELETLRGDLELIKEQTLDMKHLHSTLMSKVEQEATKTVENEEKLTEQSHDLQQQNKEEGHARKILNARIKAELGEYEMSKHNLETKKEQILKTDGNLQNAIDVINKQIEKLSTKYEERSKAVEGLDKLLAQVSEKYSKSKESTTAELKRLTSEEAELKSNTSEVSSQQQQMESTTETLNKKLYDMAASTIMMNKFLLSNEKAIEDLEEEVAELQIQLETSNNLDEKLRLSLKEVEDRADMQEKKHTDLADNRQHALNNLTDSLEKSLEENDRLATKYINLQNKHINQKNEFVKTFERNTIAQENLRDKEMLCELHTRLHEALKCYYQLRGIQTKAGLARFEDMTKTSYARLKNIQRELEKCIYNITVFLKASNKTQAFQFSYATLNTPLHALPVFS